MIGGNEKWYIPVKSKVVDLLAIAFKIGSLTAAIVAIIFVADPALAKSVTELFICFLLLLSIIGIIVEEFRWHRKARYAEALEFVHDAHHSLRDAYWALVSGKDDSMIAKDLSQSIDHFASAFSMITGVYCSATVKLLICDESTGVWTHIIAKSHKRKGADARAGQRFHNAYESTSVGDLLKSPETRVFFSNDILKLGSFMDSRFPEFKDPKETHPYRSKIVWPVRMVVPTVDPDHGNGSNGGTDKLETMGFICVDSKARGVFRRRYDVPMGAAYADSMYGFLRMWRENSMQNAADAAEGAGTIYEVISGEDPKSLLE